MNDELHMPDFNLAETTTTNQGTNEYLQTTKDQVNTCKQKQL